MYINTASQKLMVSSVCEALNVSENELDDLFEDCYNNLQKDHHIFVLDNQYDFFKEYVQEHLSKKIDSIYFTHLSRRLNDDKDNNGYNLKDVLTKETSLSHFLKKYHMTFEYDKYIRMYLCDKEVNLNEKEYYYEYLRQRFGYIYHDYSMKGLMFADDIKNSTDYQMAEGGPELLGYLYLLIDADEFIDEFIRKSTFYQFEYLVPLEQIYFDNYEDLSNDDKQCHIIIKTLQRLYFCKYDPLFNEEDNPTIGIIDNITLSEKYLINKIKIC